MVDAEEVRKVAENARISIEEEEVESFTQDFEEILGIFEKIEEIETDDVEPAFHPVDVEDRTREDEKGETLSEEEVFQNTDNVEDSQFKGPNA